MTYAALDLQLDPSLVQQAMALIESAQRIALIAHEHPDGDCLGSALGLTHILRMLGKSCTPACADPAPMSFHFLPGIGDLQLTLGDENFDLVIALDAGEFPRFGTLYKLHPAFLHQVPVLNIDHHISSSGCGTVNIIETSTAATAELLVLFQQQARLPLSKDAAVCLLTGMITDTGSFQYSNTTARTLAAAAAMLDVGAIPEAIVKPIFRTHPLSKLRFQAACTANIQTACHGRLIWSYATRETAIASGNAQDIDDSSIVGMLRDVEGVQIAAFFKNYEEPTVTRLSLRSAAPYNAADICMRFGGGGHAQAAGATLYMPIDEAMRIVIAELERVLSHDI